MQGKAKSGIGARVDALVVQPHCYIIDAKVIFTLSVLLTGSKIVELLEKFALLLSIAGNTPNASARYSEVAKGRLLN